MMNRKFKSFLEFTSFFKTDKICYKYLELYRWNKSPICPHCETAKPYELSNARMFKCRNKECRKKFNALTKTIFENTNLSLHIWFAAIYLFTSHKKGISSIQLGKDLGITQKSAWFVLQRIRLMLCSGSEIKLSNIVEMDETYVGGKRQNDKNSKEKGFQGRSTKRKVPVIGLLERKGLVRTVVVKDASSKTITDIIENNVSDDAVIMTDGWKGYSKVKNRNEHLKVDHKKGEYVSGDVHINTIEGFWSLMKRGIIGIYHKVSVKHLDYYCGEFEFRYNFRTATEMGRFNFALRQANKRVRYKELTR
jgi:transposase-like protein